MLDDTTVSTRAVIGREQQSKNIDSAAVYQRRVERQGEQQNGSILVQARSNRDEKAEGKRPAGRHGVSTRGVISREQQS